MAKQNFTAIDGTPAQQNVAATPDADSSFILIRSSEHTKATFRYAGNFTPVATPSDVLMIQGSPSSTVRIKKIMLTPASATAAGQMPVTLIRRSTQFTTKGSAVFNAVTAGRHDINDAAAGSVVSTIGTANLTSVGAFVSNIGQARLWFPIAASAAPQAMSWDFATRQDKALILRGTLDFLFINLGGAAVPSSGTLDYEIEIEEDAS